MICVDLETSLLDLTNITFTGPAMVNSLVQGVTTIIMVSIRAPDCWYGDEGCGTKDCNSQGCCEPTKLGLNVWFIDMRTDIHTGEDQ